MANCKNAICRMDELIAAILILPSPTKMGGYADIVDEVIFALVDAKANGSVSEN